MPRRTSEPSQYDRIIKENLAPLVPIIMKRVLGMEIQSIRFFPITKQQKTREREPDFACILWNKTYRKGAVVHIEFETNPKALKRYHQRMLDYYAIFYVNVGREVIQYLIYFGEGSPKFKNSILHKNLNFKFDVIYLSEMPYTDFLESKTSEEVILSILGNFQGKPAGEVIEEILSRLVYLLRNDNLKLQKLIQQLEIMSGLRKLQPLIAKKVQKMITGYKIEDDVRYQQGRKVGTKEGIEKGAELEKERKDHFFVHSLLSNCPDFSDEKIATIAAVELDFVKRIKLEMNAHPKPKNGKTLVKKSPPKKTSKGNGKNGPTTNNQN